MQNHRTGSIAGSMYQLCLALLTMAVLAVPAAAQEDEGESMPVNQVNINTADADTLALALEGVGLSRAEAIVAYREENGPFERVEELQEVSGVGPVTLENNLERLRVEGADD
ncbi:MAG: ComEA family DNA-binding protein [Pseudomonadota bacterium]